MLYDEAVVAPARCLNARVLPVVGMIGEHLKLRVGNVPVLIGSGLAQDLLHL